MSNGYSEYKTSDEYKPIRRMVVKKAVKASLLFLLYEGAFIAFGIIWGLATDFNGLLAVVMCALLGLSGLRFTGLWRIISDRFYEGKIIKIDERTVEEGKTAMVQMINFDKKNIELDIYIELPDGDVKLIKTSFKTVPHDYYKVGDEVRHYPGLALFEKRDKSKDSKVICNVCENYLSADEDICPFCGYKILK